MMGTTKDGQGRMRGFTLLAVLAVVGATLAAGPGALGSEEAPSDASLARDGRVIFEDLTQQVVSSVEDGPGARAPEARASAPVYNVFAVVDNFASAAGYLDLTIFTPTEVVFDASGIENLDVPTFDFAGESFDRIGVAADGYIVVGGRSGGIVTTGANTDLPYQLPPNSTLAPFWTDLDLAAGGSVYSETLTDGFDSWTVVEWQGVPNSADGGLNTFQVWIGWNTDVDPTQDIAFVYATISGGSDGELTVGAENQFGNRGQPVFFNGTGTPPAASFGGGSDACDLAWPAPPCFEVDVTSAPSVNDQPAAVADSYVVAEGATRQMDVTGNDTDINGDVLLPVITTPPTNGDAFVTASGAIRYTHDGSETLTDSLRYHATDGQLRTANVDVSITITPVNDPPKAVDDGPFTVEEGRAFAGQVLANDSDVDGGPLTASTATDPAHGTLALNADGSFVYTHDHSDTTTDSFDYRVSDGMKTRIATVSIIITPRDDRAHDVGLVDPGSGMWHLRNSGGIVTSFFYGNPADVPFMGDWDGDGISTPGMYRQSDGKVYLRNDNSQGFAEIEFFFGDPGDFPIIGDWDGDGDDTVSIYRPSEQKFYIINKLAAQNQGLGAADLVFAFGNPGDKPVTGDWDGDGITEIGLHRETSGFFYWRNSLTTGIADGQIFFGDPGDRFVSGDWGVLDVVDTPAVFRPNGATFFFRHSLTEGIADSQFPFGAPTYLPVAGNFGLG